MMIGSLAPLFLIAAGVPLQADPSAPAEEAEEYLLTISARPDRCSLRLATKVKLRTLAEEPHKWTGKCVAVDGYWKDRALFTAPSDARQRYGQTDKSLRRRRVGIYGTEEVLSSAPRSPVAYTAVGIAGECAKLGDGATMVMGYCHYTGGPYIAVSEIRRR
jgi:hypothetical protein